MKTSRSKFQRIFHLPKMAAILNFRIFHKNHKNKNACISKTMPDSDFSKIFDPQGICENKPFQVSTNSLLAKKMATILNFFFKSAKPRNACISKTMLDRVISMKHKNACILKTVQDRAILAKILTHRVSVNSSLSKFQRIFHLPKMAAILNFRIFFQKCKTQECLYLRNRAR